MLLTMENKSILSNSSLSLSSLQVQVKWEDVFSLSDFKGTSERSHTSVQQGIGKIFKFFKGAFKLKDTAEPHHF